MSSSKWIKCALSLLIGFLSIRWIYYSIDFGEMKNLAGQVRWLWVLIAIVFFWIEYHFRTKRWQSLFSPFIKLPYSNIWRVLIAGSAMNVLIPARLGELVRVDLCKRWLEVARPTAFATVVCERVADGITILCCLTLGFLFLTSADGEKEILRLLYLGAPLFAGGFLMLIAIKIAPLPFFKRFPRLAPKVEAFQNVLRNISSSTFFELVVYTLVIWGLEGCALWSIIQSVGVALGIWDMALLLGIVNLSTLLPSPPGFLGTLQFAFSMGFAALGQWVVPAIVAASLTQVFLIGSLTLVGLSLYGLMVFKNRLARKPLKID